MLENATVSAAIEQAWRDSQANDPNKRHEEGGWIIQNIRTGALRVVRVPAGGQAGITPGANPAGAGEQTCGFFHTHPNPPVDENGVRWTQGPSQADINWHNRHGIPGIIRNAAGTVTFGPTRGPYR
ncbi:MAG: hypothetical protein ACE5IG_04950 [Dehalococcoidia bacterium]